MRSIIEATQLEQLHGL